MTQTPAETPTTRATYGWASITVAIVFGILYAYILWSAIENLIALPAQLDSVGVPWALLIGDAALPVVTFAVAFWIGRRRSLAIRALFYFIGLTLLACATVGSIAYVQTH